MKKIFYACLIVCLAWSAEAQTYNQDIAKILFDNCTSCHHQGGIAPNSLMNYNEVLPYASTISAYVTSKEMPPWPPNNQYQQYAHDKSLTNAEIQSIVDWVNNGSPQGTGTVPTAPIYNNNKILTGTPDLQLGFPNQYMSKASNTADDYICVTIPTGLTSAKYVKAIEVIPGNPEIVHHCLVYADQGGVNSTDTTGLCAGPTGGKLLAGFAPGELPTVFPHGSNLNMGIKLEPGSDIILAMHYPEGSYGRYDSTSVHIYFHDNSSTVREVTATPILQNWGFCVPANATQTVTSQYPSGAGVIPNDYSLLSVFPHMHLLGKDFLVYAVTLTQDTIPLIHVPHWDFEWQGFYFFKNMIKLPAGAKIYGKSTYDNTTNNHHNPNNPPQQVCAGLNTSDEMHLVYFHFTPYVTGDETYDMDSLLVWDNPMTNFSKLQGREQINALVYPNPMQRELRVEYFVEQANKVEITVHQLNGQEVYRHQEYRGRRGKFLHRWTLDKGQAAKLAEGMYIVNIKIGEHSVQRKVMLKH